MKKCFKCDIEKPLAEFYKHPQMADGHLNKCKQCSKNDVSKNYRENISHYRDYEKARAGLPHRAIARNEYSKTAEGKKSIATAKASWTRRNPIKRMANIIVGNATRAGRIIKSDRCENCGSLPTVIHGHHDDYAFPLVVRWLCPGCHNKWHKENGEGINAR